MEKKQAVVPDHTAVRVALWRAMHVQLDSPPHVLVDEIGLQLAAPEKSWRERPDMDPQRTRGYRASIVGRARFIEDLVEGEARNGIEQYVILGAGLDTFAQRRPDVVSKLGVFEIDKPETQQWKRQRLSELRLPIPGTLRFVPVDFEAGDLWWEKLALHGYETSQPAFVASTGVAMYLTKETNLATLRQIAALASGSTLAMTFMLPSELVDEAERKQYEMVQERARASGTPFLSFFRPAEIVALAKEAGFREARHVSRNEIIEKYFSNRADGLLPASGEEFLIATT